MEFKVKRVERELGRLVGYWVDLGLEKMGMENAGRRAWAMNVSLNYDLQGMRADEELARRQVEELDKVAEDVRWRNVGAITWGRIWWRGEGGLLQRPTDMADDS